MSKHKHKHHHDHGAEEQRQEAQRQEDANRVVIFDTTLRDGEQSPGASMTLEEKLEVADLLDAMGVDIIEAGFPIASHGDFETVARWRSASKRGSVAGLARASEKDIDRCAEALREAKRPRIHTFISTSPLHMKYKLQMEPERVLEIVASSVARARNHVEDVEWSAEDGTRTEIEFLCRCVEIAIRAGATTINIPDTVGYTTPAEYESLFRTCANACRTPTRRSSPCIATTIWASRSPIRSPAFAAGARQIECTINGIGERAGNAALEEIVMALRTRPDALPFHTGIDDEAADARVKARLGGDVLSGAIQQGDRRPERFRA